MRNHAELLNTVSLVSVGGSIIPVQAIDLPRSITFLSTLQLPGRHVCQSGQDHWISSLIQHSVLQTPSSILQRQPMSQPRSRKTTLSITPVIDVSATTVRALVLGLMAAATYSVANLALRGLSRPDGGVGWDMWVAGTKAFPTFFVAIVLLTIRRYRGQTSFAAWSFVWPIALAAFFNQLGGNFAFQMSLSKIGLAISVPICFASIICSGAIVGRYVLGDQVSVRTGISMGLMVASIVFLSTAARNRATVVPTTADWGTATGVALAVISGLAYGITGVYIRKAVRSQMPVAATLFLFSAAGFLMLCPLSLCLLPAADDRRDDTRRMGDDRDRRNV